MVAVYTWEDFNGITGPGYHAMLGEELVGAAAARHHRRPLRRRPGGRGRRREPLPRRGRVRADRGRLRASAAGRRLHDRRRRHREHRARGLGPRVERDGGGAVHAALPRPRRGRSPAPRTSWSATSCRTATSPCPWRPAASWRRTHAGRDELEIVVRDAVGARDPQLLQPLPPDPRRQRAGDGSRRRRRLRPEDVRVPGGVRGRAGVAPARAPGEVDRGPAREPARRPATPATSTPTSGWRSTTTASSRPSPSTPRPTSARTRCARRRSTRCSLPGPYKIPRYGFAMEMVWTNTMGKAAYRGPWMFETTAREMAIDHAANEIGLDPAEFRRRNLLAASDLPFTAPTGNVFQEITPLETLEQALEILDYEAFRKEQAAALAEGRYLGVGICCYVEPTSMGGNTLATEAATVQGRDQRPGHGLPRHHVARPEHRDHHGADRRRAPRGGVRRRHHRPGRHAVDALRTRHRREPHRGRRRRRGARGDRRGAREGARDRRAHDGGGTRRPRDRRERRLGARHAVEVGHHEGRRQAGVAQRRRAAGRDGQRARGDGAVPAEAVPHLVERHARLRGRDRRRDAGSRR